MVIVLNLAAQGQTLLDSFSDGDTSVNPTWSGDTANWTIVANSDAAAGATTSQTLRLNAPAVSQTEHLRTQIANWGDSQEWGIWIGIRGQALTAANTRYVWLYANEANLESATVDGYRLAIGDDTGNDEIRLERILNGAVAATVITSSGAMVNAITDVGFLVRVTRNSSGLWTLFTSTLPATSGTGAIASDAPSSANTTVSQGVATDNVLPLVANGYFGVAVLHSTGSGAIIGTEFDQIYFTSTSACTPPATQSVSGATTICSGSSAIVNLNGSETGVTYYLKDGPTTVTTASGTGSGISFSAISPISTTTYTVVATNDTTSCGATMSGSALVTVDSPVTPSVTVLANPGTTTCAGNQVIFTATPVNGGGSPSYVWKTNGVQDASVPTTSGTYTNSNLANGETIDCQLTSSLTCVTASTANAPQLVMTITSTVTPAVSASPNPGATICAEVKVIFTATPVNGGSSPSYIWKTNGVQDTSVSSASATYTNTSLANGETVDCRLISTDPCASPTTTDATQIVMTVNPTVTPAVSIAADPGSVVCSNSSVTLTATPVNGGVSPTYQWKTNNANVTGQTAATFTTSLLKNGDVVTVVMTPSSDICVSPATATSSGITMMVSPIPSSTITAAGGIVQNSTGNLASVPDAGAGATYVWTISGGTITAGQGTSSITYSAGGTIGTLTLGCTVTSSAGCSSVGSLIVSVHAPVLAAWDVSTMPGGANNFGPSLLSPTSSDANLSIGGFARGSGVVTTGATGAARGWGGVDWQSTSAANAVTANKFATFTVSAHTGYKVSFNAISRFDYRRSGTGATSGTLQYQVGGADTFHDITTVSYTSSAASGGVLSPIDLSGITALQDVPAGTVVTFRIVNYGGTSSAGTWYIFDVANNTASDFEVAGYVACIAPTATVAGDSVICAGDSTSFATTLSGVPPWNVTWSDGVTSNNVASSPVMRTVSPGSTITYTVTSLSDSINCAPGTFSGSATVTVNPLPMVTILPATTNAECAGDVTFTANVSGDGPLTYQWYNNQTNAIAGETNLTLTLSNVHATAAGNYAIVVTGPFCSASAVASLAVTDTLAPGLMILGANPTTNECHVAYVDAGATATDACTGVVGVSTNNLVNANAPGVYTVTYTADDGNGNTNTAARTVYVVDTIAPTLTILGANPATNECHVAYVDSGATASDVCAGSVSVSTNSLVNANMPGVYSVTYTTDDGNGNTNSLTRTVYIVDTVAPTVTVLGANPYTNFAYVAFVDPGATAVDACDVSASVTTNGTVDITTPGSYALEYVSTDASGNSATNRRTVQVVALASPTITSEQKLSNGAFEVTFTGPNGQPYKLVTSTDVTLAMPNWTTLTTGAFGGNPVTYTDNTATNDSVRFYRVVSP